MAKKFRWFDIFLKFLKASLVLSSIDMTKISILVGADNRTIAANQK
jgi:hypothetical protein